MTICPPARQKPARPCRLSCSVVSMPHPTDIPPPIDPAQRANIKIGRLFRAKIVKFKKFKKIIYVSSVVDEERDTSRWPCVHAVEFVLIKAKGRAPSRISFTIHRASWPQVAPASARGGGAPLTPRAGFGGWGWWPLPGLCACHLARETLPYLIRLNTYA